MLIQITFGTCKHQFKGKKSGIVAEITLRHQSL